MLVDETQSLPPTRTSFIRSLPESMPVEEVIERGRELGLKIQPSDVHSTRYYMRQEADAMLSAVPSRAKPLAAPVQLHLPGRAAPAPATKAAPVPVKTANGRTTITLPRDADRDEDAPTPAPIATSRRKQKAAAPAGRTAAPVGRAAAPVSRPVRARSSPEPTAAEEERIRSIVLRIGTDRVHEIIAKIEESTARTVLR